MKSEETAAWTAYYNNPAKQRAELQASINGVKANIAFLERELGTLTKGSQEYADCLYSLHVCDQNIAAMEQRLTRLS